MVVIGVLQSGDPLRARGVSFAMNLATANSRIIEAEGQVVGGRAILRLRLATGLKYELAELRQRHQRLTSETAALRALVDATYKEAA